MATLKTLFFLLSFSFFIAGCESVSSLSPVGNTSVQTPVEQWQGSWLGEGGILHTKVTNAEKGELLLIIVELSKDTSNLLETHPLTVRKTGDNYYFNLLDNNEAKGQYYFSKFTLEGNEIKAYLPIYKSVSDRIKSGKLKGTVDKSDSNAVLTGSRAEINNYIESHPEIFNSEKVLVFKKITN